MMRNGGIATYQRPKPSKASLNKFTRIILLTKSLTVHFPCRTRGLCPPRALEKCCNARAKPLRRRPRTEPELRRQENCQYGPGVTAAAAASPKARPGVRV